MERMSHPPVCSLRAHMIQHPDAAGTFFHGKHQLILGERKLDRRYLPRNHRTGTFKCRHLERFSPRLSAGRIEMDSPHVKNAAMVSNEDSEVPSPLREERQVLISMASLGSQQWDFARCLSTSKMGCSDGIDREISGKGCGPT